MEKLQTFVQDKIGPIMEKISGSFTLKVMMSSFMMLFPVTMIGSLSSLLTGLPIAGWQAFLNNTGFGYYLALPTRFTTEIFGLLMAFAVTYSYLKAKENNNAVTGGLISLIAFLILTPVETSVNEYGMAVTKMALGSLSFYAAMGLFTSLISGFLIGMAYNWITTKGWTIKMPDSVPPFISQAFAGIVPSVLIILPVIIIAYLMSLTPFGSVHAVTYGLIQLPLQNIGGSFGAMLFVAILSQVLWFFGIHGSMATLSVMMPIWMAFDQANLLAYQAQLPIPHIVSMTFFNIYTPGGFGISTAIVLLLSKSQRYKTLGKLSIVPAAFNITEPLIFGMPLVMNPIYFIPYVFSNVIGLTIAYLVTKAGIVPAPAGISTTGIPVIIQAFLQGSWKIAALQGILIIVIALFWLPFIMVADRRELKEEMALEETA